MFFSHQPHSSIHYWNFSISTLIEILKIQFLKNAFKKIFVDITNQIFQSWSLSGKVRISSHILHFDGLGHHKEGSFIFSLYCVF